MASTVGIPYRETTPVTNIHLAEQVNFAVLHAAPPVDDVHKAIRQALPHHIDSPELTAQSKPGKRVNKVFIDITRFNADQLLVPALLEALE